MEIDDGDLDSNETPPAYSPANLTRSQSLSSSTMDAKKQPSLHPFLPDLSADLTEDGYGEYKWSIQDFTKLREKAIVEPEQFGKIFSPDFCVNGEWWRLLLFPNGNDADHLSVFFEYLGAKNSQKPNWSRCAQFAIRIANPSHDECSFSKDAIHRFNPGAVDWGFNQFIRLAFLTLPHENQGISILENDSFDLWVYFRTVKDPTGTLWHNFQDWDSKKETGYIGLKNQGATCYMNSLLQSLFCTNAFRKYLFLIPTENDEPTKSVALALQRLFYNLATSDHAADTRELTKSFGWDTLDAFMQHDIQEFNRVLQDNLETKMKGTKAEGAIEKLFVGKMKSYIKCVNVNYESSREEAFYDVQLNVKGKSNLYESFKDYISVEMLDGENKYRAEQFGLQDAKKGVIFTKFPPVLHLQLKRFEYDFQRDAMVKINDRHEFPLEINLSEFLEDGVQKTEGEQKYHLHGVMVHSGDVHGGHYCAFIRPKEENNWFKFDDDRVVPVLEREALDENYGENPQAKTNVAGGMTPPLHIRRMQMIKRFTNAYMLVYIRDSDRPEILKELTEDDIPKHLAENILMEKQRREQLAVEAAERHMYYHVTLIRDQDISKYQGFDLFNPEERDQLLTLKVKKSMLFHEFISLVSDNIHLEPEKIRLWNFYIRRNNTRRVERPIPYDAHANWTLEKIYTAFSQMHNDFRLYLDTSTLLLTDSTGRKTYFLEPSQEANFLFIKYYDMEKQELEYLGKICVKSTIKASELQPLLNELKGFPPNTAIQLFEEIKPGMICPLKLKQTLAEAEIGTGDIICFQKEPTKEQEKLSMCSAVSYYEYLQMRIVLEFRPKTKADFAGEFLKLVLSRKMTYDEVLSRLGKTIQADPFKIRLSYNPTGEDRPKNILKRHPGQTLHEILQTSFYQSSNVHPIFWFEKTDLSITELENKKSITVTAVDHNLRERDSVHILVSKSGTVADLARLLEESKIRFTRIFEVLNGKTIKYLQSSDPIGQIGDFSSQVFVDTAKSEDITVGPNEKLVTVFHFFRDPQRTHSVPFQIGISAGSTLLDVKKKVQARLGISEKDLQKIKFSIVGHVNRVRYLEDDNEFVGENFEHTDLIGLDHVDRNARGTEKSIKIHN